MPFYDVVLALIGVVAVFFIASVVTAFSSAAVDGHIQVWSNPAFRLSFRLFLVSLGIWVLFVLTFAGAPLEVYVIITVVGLSLAVMRLQYRVGRLQREMAILRSSAAANATKP